MDPNTSRILKVGLAVMGAILGAYLLIAWGRRLQPFASEEARYVIRFDNVNGLLEGDPVQVRGYQIGRVTDIQASAEAVRAEIAIDRSMVLHEGASAEIQIKELMSGKQILLSPGPAAAPPLPEGAELPGRISLDFASSFSRIGEAMEQADPQQITLLLKRMDTITRGLSRLMARMESIPLEPLLADTRSLMQSARSALSQLDAPALTARLDSTLETTNRLMAASEPLLLRLDRLTAEAETGLLPRADSLADEAATLIPLFKASLADACSLLRTLQSPEGLAGRMLSDPAFADRLDESLIRLNAVLQQVNEEKIIVGFRRKRNAEK